METIEALSRRSKSAEDLQSIVTTMKTMAAAKIWHYEQAVAALAEYERTVELGLQIALRERTEGVEIARPTLENRLGAIILGSDQGLVGRFNDHVARYAIDKMKAMGADPAYRHLIAVGRRLRRRLETERQPIAAHFDMPSSIAGLRPTIQAMMAWLERWQSEQAIDCIMLFFNRPLSGASYEPHGVQLLPVDLNWLQDLQQRPWPSRSLPTFDMEWEALFSALIREYFFVAVDRAFASSLAAENASRLSSMQAAERNIEERLDELNMQYHQLRQSTITAELLDIVSGAEAVTGRLP